jgi:hypothetical protein
MSISRLLNVLHHELLNITISVPHGRLEKLVDEYFQFLVRKSLNDNYYQHIHDKGTTIHRLQDGKIADVAVAESALGSRAFFDLKQS